MPTNQEWLHKLANESPYELKAWFDAEHNDDLAAEKVVSGDAAHSNDGNAHLKAHSKTESLLTEQSESLSDEADSREKLMTWAAFAQTNEGGLINEVRVKQSVIDSLSQELDDITDERNMLQRRNAELRTSYDKLKQELEAAKSMKQFSETRTDASHYAFDVLKGEYDKLEAERDKLTAELEAEHALVVQFEYDNERIKAERDNLADDLLTCNREREHLREHLGIALDHAHDICALVDIGE